MVEPALEQYGSSTNPKAEMRPRATKLLIIIRLRSYTCRGQMAQEDRRGLSWKRENEVSEEWIQFVDDNVLAGKAELELSVA
jgi:hypothetical protein